MFNFYCFFNFEAIGICGLLSVAVRKISLIQIENELYIAVGGTKLILLFICLSGVIFNRFKITVIFNLY